MWVCGDEGGDHLITNEGKDPGTSVLQMRIEVLMLWKEVVFEANSKKEKVEAMATSVQKRERN